MRIMSCRRKNPLIVIVCGMSRDDPLIVIVCGMIRDDPLIVIVCGMSGAVSMCILLMPSSSLKICGWLSRGGRAIVMFATLACGDGRKERAMEWARNGCWEERRETGWGRGGRRG